MHPLYKDFILFFSVIDPIGTIPVFLYCTRFLSNSEKTRVANKAVLIALGILLCFIIFGQMVLEALSIPLSAFQITGGIILFIFATTMIFGESKPETELSDARGKTLKDLAVFPLAMPSIASPGAMMACVLLTDNYRFNIQEQALTALMLLAVLIITYLLLRFSIRIQRVIGDMGANILSRISGLLLASIAVDSILVGIQKFFSI